MYVDWQDNSTKETRFEIERKTGAAGTYALITTVPGDAVRFRRYVDNAVTEGTIYYYRMRGCNAGGCSAYGEASTAAPTVSTGAATNIRRNNFGSGDATISGNVDPNANDYMVWFEYRSGSFSGAKLRQRAGLRRMEVRRLFRSADYPEHELHHPGKLAQHRRHFISVNGHFHGSPARIEHAAQTGPGTTNDYPHAGYGNAPT